MRAVECDLEDSRNLEVFELAERAESAPIDTATDARRSKVLALDVRSAKTARLQRQFLAAYAELGAIQGAAAKAGINRQDHYNWLAKDPSYEARFREAEEAVADSLEQAAIQRAREGAEEYIPNPHTGIVYGKDGKPIKQRRFNEQLTIALLRAHRPRKYREEQRIELSGKVEFSKPEVNIVLVKQVMQNLGSLPLPEQDVIEGELVGPELRALPEQSEEEGAALESTPRQGDENRPPSRARNENGKKGSS
jgi:hypothetical protein